MVRLVMKEESNIATMENGIFCALLLTINIIITYMEEQHQLCVISLATILQIVS